MPQHPVAEILRASAWGERCRYVVKQMPEPREESERAREAAPATRSGRDLREQVALLAAQVRRLGERVGGEPARPEPADDRPLGSSILETAERFAAEIRASAEREAERLRSDATRDPDVRLNGLAAMIDRHRDTLALLAAEHERSSAGLRAQIHALEGELAAIRATISALLES
jgi:hypothetical protein